MERLNKLECTIFRSINLEASEHEKKREYENNIIEVMSAKKKVA